MAKANPRWGAPRIHGELLKLGIEISERTVSNLMPRRDDNPSSQTWRTFLKNHLTNMASIDFFTVSTATFRILFVLLILEETEIPHRAELLSITVITVALSVILHGISSAPLAKAYGRLVERMGECAENRVVSDMPLREGLPTTNKPEP